MASPLSRFCQMLAGSTPAALNWTATGLLIRCCEGNGITPVIRVQSNPWLGYDHNIAVDVTRLISIGAKYILISNS